MPNDASETRIYWLHALSPVHVGSGRGIGFIDLPIMREAVTGWPLVPGSAMKGVLADSHGVTDKSRKDNLMHKLAFGVSDDENSNSGSIVFTDAHLVCLPVRSLYGTFAWCACPMSLERLRRDLDSAGLGSSLPSVEIPPPNGNSGAYTAVISVDPPSVLSDGATTPKVYLEDLDFLSVGRVSAGAWAKAIGDWVFGASDPWTKRFQERFAVVPDDVFNFLCSSLPVDARVKIDRNTKTVADGQLWYEESLPAESILSGVAWCGPIFGRQDRSESPSRAKIVNEFCRGKRKVQIGGKATVGRGQVAVSFTSQPSAVSSGQMQSQGAA